MSLDALIQAAAFIERRDRGKKYKLLPVHCLVVKKYGAHILILK